MKTHGAILHCGVHIPRLRLPRALIVEALAWLHAAGRAEAHGARAICNWDEDALTMAVEASRHCLVPGTNAAYGGDAKPAAVIFCSTTSPFADRDPAVLLAAAIDLPEECESLNIGGSLRAGTGGLISAARRLDGSSTLCVASDARQTRPGSVQEMAYGDGAVALLVGPESASTLATIIGARSVGTDFVDHYRMNGSEFDYALEQRWVRDEALMIRIPEVVADLLHGAGETADAIKHLILPAGGGTASRVAQACGLTGARRDERVLTECGDAGAALPLLMLAGALETAQPGELIIVLGLGQGVDALLLRAGPGARRERGTLAQALSHRHEETSYVRYLSHRGLIDVDFGMRAERDQRTAHSVAYRKRAAITGFKGGCCERCGTVQFPQSRVCVNPDCRATDTQVAHRFADSTGRVKSFTEDWQAYAARPPYSYGNVEFKEGGNLLMEFTDIDAGQLKVNDVVRFVFRIKDEDRARGFRRYFWKATLKG